MSIGLDTIENWLLSRNAAFLSKENVIVYYESPTGRINDFEWFEVTPTELCRILNIGYLSEETRVSIDDVIQVFQEQSRVFTMGVKSNYPTKEEYFNFNLEANADSRDTLVDALLRILCQSSVRVVKRETLVEILTKAVDKLDLSNYSPQLLNELVNKHASKYDYDIRFGTNKPLIKQQRRAALIQFGYKPADYVRLDESEMPKIVKKLIGEVK